MTRANIKWIDEQDVPGFLAGVRAQIPARVLDEVEAVFPADNDSLAFELYHAIKALPDPQKAFELWKDFNFGPLTIRSYEFKLGMEDVLGWHNPEKLVAFHAACIAASEALPKNAQKDKPFRATIAALLEPRIKQNWGSSLDGLKKSVATLLVTPAVYKEVQAILLRKFDVLAQEARDPHAGVQRQNLSELPLHVPDGVTFGVEFEGMLPTNQDLEQSMEALTIALRADGLTANCKEIPGFKTPDLFIKFGRYYHDWLLTVDATVKNPFQFLSNAFFDRNYGLELISPVLQGEAGLKQLVRAHGTLEDNRFMTNSTTGFHVSVGLKDISLEELKNLCEAFVKNEKALDAFVHPDRRGDQNQYGISQTHIGLERIRAAESIGELVDIVSPVHSHYKMDLASLMDPASPARAQYRGEGGRGYMDQAVPYTVLLVHFTKMARQNPDVTVRQVLAAIHEGPTRQHHGPVRGAEPSRLAPLI
jgi:hypothetical protein